MKNLFLPIALVGALLSSPATAQIIPSSVQQIQGTDLPNRGNPVNVNPVDLNGNSLATSGGMNVQGTVASSSADSGNPVKVGGVYNTSGPAAYSDGQRTNFQTGQRGALQVQLMIADSTTALSSGGDNNDGFSAVAAGRLVVTPRNYIYNGTVWDRARTIQGADGTGIGIAAVAPAPQSTAGGALAGTASTAVESGRVFKASAGNAYRFAITTGATPGFFMAFNATTIPADGAVTPVICRVIAANSTLSMSFESMPVRFSTGVSVAFSSTGCFTKTASATAFLEGYVQ